MTNAMSNALEHYLTHHTFLGITNTVSIVAVFLLLAIAIEREVLRSARPHANKSELQPFLVVLLPTLLIFAATIVARFLELT